MNCYCDHTGGDNDRPNLSVIHSGDYFFVIVSRREMKLLLVAGRSFLLSH